MERRRFAYSKKIFARHVAGRGNRKADEADRRDFEAEGVFARPVVGPPTAHQTQALDCAAQISVKERAF